MGLVLSVGVKVASVAAMLIERLSSKSFGVPSSSSYVVWRYSTSGWRLGKLDTTRACADDSNHFPLEDVMVFPEYCLVIYRH